MEPRLAILAAALVFVGVALIAFLAAVVRSVRKHQVPGRVPPAAEQPSLPQAPERVVDADLEGLELPVDPGSMSASLRKPLKTGDWIPPSEPAPSERLAEASLAERIASYEAAELPAPPRSPAPPAPSAMPESGTDQEPAAPAAAAASDSSEPQPPAPQMVAEQGVSRGEPAEVSAPPPSAFEWVRGPAEEPASPPSTPSEPAPVVQEPTTSPGPTGGERAVPVQPPLDSESAPARSSVPEPEPEPVQVAPVTPGTVSASAVPAPAHEPEDAGAKVVPAAEPGEQPTFEFESGPGPEATLPTQSAVEPATLQREPPAGESASTAPDQPSAPPAAASDESREPGADVIAEEPPAASRSAQIPHPAEQSEPEVTPPKLRPTTVVRSEEAAPPAPVDAPAPAPSSRIARPRAHVLVDLESAPTPAPASEHHTGEHVPVTPGLRAESAEFNMVAPVEMWFGDSRVGVKAGTQTYAKFRKYADVLLGDLKGVKTRSR